MKALWFFWPNKDAEGQGIGEKLKEIPGVGKVYLLGRKIDIYTGVAEIEGNDWEDVSKTITTRLAHVEGIEGFSTRFVVELP